MHEGLQALLWLGAILIAYAFLGNRLLRATDPLREKAGRMALELLRDERLPVRFKRGLARGIEDLMNPWRAWYIVLTVPYFAIVARGRPDPLDEISDKALRRQVRSTVGLITLAVVSNSVAATALLLLQAVVAILFAVPIAKTLDLVAAAANGRRSTRHA